MFHIESEIEALFPSRSITGSELIQELWSGYGEIRKYRLSDGSSVIVKHVKLPELSQHPRGWDTDISYQRKLKSYDVEISWYEEFAQRHDSHCRMPSLFTAKKEEQELLMIMEDLDGAGFPERRSNLTASEIRACLHWLAHFHAKYLSVQPEALWTIGTYWHLDTRPDELKVMGHQRLKHAAHKIDGKLGAAKFQTIVHGDAKAANFCFSETGNQVAAVDFQYVGKGCGMKDVAYFLSSCLSEYELEEQANTFVDYYFEVLEGALDNTKVDIGALIREWRSLYAYAWADFYRFLDGWSPGHWKMHGYSSNQTEQALERLQVEEHLDGLCHVAKEAALKAGTFIQSAIDSGFEVLNSKSGHTEASQVLTEVDIKSQDIILSHLEESIAAHDLGLLCEEGAQDASRLDKHYFWCIDPMDGTLAFINGTTGYSVSIALVDKYGESLIGVVYRPDTKELYTCIKGQGVFKNGQLRKGADYNQRSLKWYADRSLLKEPSFDRMEVAIRGHAEKEHLEYSKVITGSGAVVNAIEVMSAAHGIYFKRITENKGGGCIWDFAATNLFFIELGLFVCSMKGTRVNLNDSRTVYMNHQGMFYGTALDPDGLIATINSC